MEAPPEKPGALPNCNRPELQAATLVGFDLQDFCRKLAIGIARGFIASGISRSRSTCRSPFSSLAALDHKHSRQAGSCAQKGRSAMPLVENVAGLFPRRWPVFSPRIVSMFSFASIERSASVESGDCD